MLGWDGGISAKAFGDSDPDHRQEKRRADARHFSWLGWRDSNPRILVPETSALPLGHIPLVVSLFWIMTIRV